MISDIFWYFYVPIGITFTINVVFFVLIALRIREIQRNITVERTQDGGPQIQKALNKKKEK